jgi:hypothetical protein
LTFFFVLNHNMNVLDSFVSVDFKACTHILMVIVAGTCRVAVLDQDRHPGAIPLPTSTTTLATSTSTGCTGQVQVEDAADQQPQQ